MDEERSHGIVRHLIAARGMGIGLSAGGGHAIVHREPAFDSHPHPTMPGPGRPHAVILAGPNGAGKSTLAPWLLAGELGVRTFVNADVIAQGLAGFDPASAAIEAGRIMLRRLDEMRRAGADFAFETTLSGLAHRRTIRRLHESGYETHLVYLWLPSPDTAVERVRTRVRLGGHDVPERDVRRRYARSLRNSGMPIDPSCPRGGCTTRYVPWTSPNPH
jgi:predicted ABC-type ATPase